VSRITKTALGAGAATLITPELSQGRSVLVEAAVVGALEHFGVLAELGRLEPDGWPLSAPGSDVTFLPGSLRAAVQILYRAEIITWSGGYDFTGLDRRRYQRMLIRIADLFQEAHRSGAAVRLQL
jgi:hypothetical protein